MFIHRCRFVDYVPATINSLAFTSPSLPKLLLACGRANGDIEIWEPKERWNLQKTIPGMVNTTVETLVWINRKSSSSNQSPRLFSGSLNGLIIEWDLIKLKMKKSADSLGGAVWCMKPNYANTMLAIGCEDGSIRIFGISDDDEEEDLRLIKVFTRINAKVISLDWGYDDKYLVSGSSDGIISKWDVDKGRCDQRMTAETSKGSETIIWAVKILKDEIIVSGDSLGNVQFWDGKMGTMLQTFKIHEADVLCLETNRSGTEVFSSGVDRKCCLFRYVDLSLESTSDDADLDSIMSLDDSTNINHIKNLTEQWVSVGYRRQHSHNVGALAYFEDQDFQVLVSGSVDTTLSVSPRADFPHNKFRHLPFTPQKPLICLSKSKQLLMFRSDNSIKLWKLGKAISQENSSYEKIPKLYIQEPQQAVLEMTLKCDSNLCASAISQDGEWIAVSDITRVKLFRVVDDKMNDSGGLVVRKINFPKIDQEYIGAHHLLFTPDNRKLIVVLNDCRIIIFGLDISRRNNKIEILTQFKQIQNEQEKGSITSIAISNDSLWLACGDELNRIRIFNLEKLKYHSTLPIFSSKHTSLTFDPFESILVITLTNNIFYLWNIIDHELTNWSRQYSNCLPDKFLCLQDKIIGCTFNPTNNKIMILWTSRYFCFIDFSKKVKSKLNLFYCHANIQLVTRYKQIMYLDFISPDSLVIVEKTLVDILEQLPPAFYVSKYGT
nr:14375_t:CDS:10 [Entrophospora candida]